MSGWFAVIDTAQDERLYPLVQHCAERTCLLSGELGPALAAAAPWLVGVDEAEPLVGLWRTHGAGRNWGILIESEDTLATLRKHLRRFLQAMLPDGSIVTFRFFDPRVFAVYLPAAPPEQQADWFAAARQFAVEGEGGVQHSFRWRGGRLYDGDAPAVPPQTGG